MIVMRMYYKACLRLIIAGIFVFVLASCGTKSTPIKVEQKACFLKHFTHLPEVVYDLYIVVDVPVEGPKHLTDSITEYLNETLYEFFDDDEERHLPYESVYTTDLEHLAEHYREAYRPFFLANSTETHEFETDCLELRLVAQTDAYVTYEVNWIFFGEGLEVANNWVTFVKKDGHRLMGVISNGNMLRFFEDHHELIGEEMWEEIQWDLGQGIDVWLATPVGLLNDSVAYQYVYAPGIFEDLIFPMEAIKPYLSREPQKLVSGKSRNK